MSSSEEDNDVEMEDKEDGEESDENMLRIMVATDNHLGFGVKNRTLKDDSFITMEEILRKCHENNVDLLLLGGDLFHHNKPCRETMHRAMKLFRKYCFGNSGVDINILSNQNKNFKSNLGSVNFEDPNYNVSLPVFSIHGNHDDPRGENPLSAMDLLSVNNLVNYFGKSTSVQKIKVSPVIIGKGSTKLCLYGLGYINDQRIYRMFEQKKVTFERPQERLEEYFNLLVLHQNRNQHHTQKSSVGEAMLKGFFDLVVWGHEHEQRAKAEPTNFNYEIIQPGSSVIVSCNPEEVEQKKIVLLKIKGTDYQQEEIPLTTVRPFLYQRIDLQTLEGLEEEDVNDTEAISEVLTEKVQLMIREARNKSLLSEETIKKNPMLELPRIRLRVDYGEHAVPNPQRFGQKFVTKVANPTDMIVFHRRKKKAAKKKSGGLSKMVLEAKEGMVLEDFISKRLLESEQDLDIIHRNEFTEAVQSFVVKDEPDAITKFVKKEVEKAQKVVWRSSIKEQKKNVRINPVVIQDLLLEYKGGDDDDEDKPKLEVKNERGSESEGEGEIDDVEPFMSLPPSPSRTSESDEEREKKKKTKKKAPKKKKASSRRKKKAPKKKAKKTRRRRKKKEESEEDGWEPEAQADNDFVPKKESESEEEPDFIDTFPQEDDISLVENTFVSLEDPLPVRKKRKRKPPKKEDMIVLDSDGIDDFELNVPPKKKRKKKKKKKKKFVRISSSDEA